MQTMKWKHCLAYFTCSFKVQAHFSSGVNSVNFKVIPAALLGLVFKFTCCILFYVYISGRTVQSEPHDMRQNLIIRAVDFPTFPVLQFLDKWVKLIKYSASIRSRIKHPKKLNSAFQDKKWLCINAETSVGRVVVSAIYLQMCVFSFRH